MSEVLVNFISSIFVYYNLFIFLAGLSGVLVRQTNRVLIGYRINWRRNHCAKSARDFGLGSVNSWSL